MKVYELIQQQKLISCPRDCLQRGYHHKCYFSNENNENCKDYRPAASTRKEEESALLEIKKTP